MNKKIIRILLVTTILLISISVFTACGRPDLEGTWYDSIYSDGKFIVTNDNHFSYGSALSGGELTINDDNSITLVSKTGDIKTVYYEEKDGDECITQLTNGGKLSHRFYKTEEIADKHRESDKQERNSK